MGGCSNLDLQHCWDCGPVECVSPRRPPFARGCAGVAGCGLFHPDLWSPSSPGDSYSCVQAADAEGGRCALTGCARSLSQPPTVSREQRRQTFFSANRSCSLEYVAWIETRSEAGTAVKFRRADHRGAKSNPARSALSCGRNIASEFTYCLWDNAPALKRCGQRSFRLSPLRVVEERARGTGQSISVHLN